MARKKAAQAALAAQGRFTPANAKRALALVKVLGPAVVPVVAPFVMQGAAAARERLDRRRARRLGVAVDDLGQYTGRGGALHARISGAAVGISEVRTKAETTPADIALADESESTLRKLAAAVRAAERMPAARRKAAHRAVSRELDRIEEQLLATLGVWHNNIPNAGQGV
ncbi:DUF6474 family protein [Actinokineospora sp. G85]|uniref:DUF6474 family protein n=1 Tax=Actinokineospora sp. G85 TaxID=3406626 RepID=UPI003C711667